MARDAEKKKAYDRQRYANADKSKVMADRRRYYEANKEQILERTMRWTKIRMANNRKLVMDLKDQPCMDCKTIYPSCCMDFDHRPGEIKGGGISQMFRIWKISQAVLQAELDKCDVVCSNCHRIRTMERMEIRNE